MTDVWAGRLVDEAGRGADTSWVAEREGATSRRQSSIWRLLLVLLLPFERTDPACEPLPRVLTDRDDPACEPLACVLTDRDEPAWEPACEPPEWRPEPLKSDFTPPENEDFPEREGAARERPEFEVPLLVDLFESDSLGVMVLLERDDLTELVELMIRVVL